MTNETTTTTANKPIAYLYYSKKATRRGAKDRLVRIGAVFAAHRSRNGRTHILDALPVGDFDGRIVELEPNDDEPADDATA